jgi:hypothetical protein
MRSQLFEEFKVGIWTKDEYLEEVQSFGGFDRRSQDRTPAPVRSGKQQVAQ